jgi:hypothetical protein
MCHDATNRHRDVGGHAVKRRSKVTDFTRLHQQPGPSSIDLIEVSRSTGYRYQAGTSDPSGAAKKLLEDAAATRVANTVGWFRFIDLFAGDRRSAQRLSASRTASNERVDIDV